MKFTISHFMDYPCQRVWQALLDPDVLSRSLPGVKRFEQTGPDNFSATLEIGVPVVRGEYAGEVEILDKVPHSSFRLVGNGKGSGGWAKGEAKVSLEPEATGTRLVAEISSSVGGPIAGVGQRMIEGVAKSIAREFFETIDRNMKGGAEKVSTVGFGLRALIAMLRSLIAGMFGRASDAR